MSSIISQLPSTPMLTQNYTGLACLAVLKLQSGLCQLFGTETKLQTKKITAGSVILIASLLSSILESSASPDINPWIWKSNSVPEDCQGPRGHRLQRAVAFPSPAWLPKPHGSCSGQRNNGPAPSWRWSSLAVGQVGSVWPDSAGQRPQPYPGEGERNVLLLWELPEPGRGPLRPEKIRAHSPRHAGSAGKAIFVLRAESTTN